MEIYHATNTLGWKEYQDYYKEGAISFIPLNWFDYKVNHVFILFVF